MWRKIAKFRRQKPELRLLLLEAFFYLAWARILKALPFSRVAPTLGAEMKETSFEADPERIGLLRDISLAVRLAGRNTWWESKCLVMAVACMKMLERRRLESTLYLGTARDNSGQWIAHAWLRCGPYYLTGYDEAPMFTVAGKFAKFLPSDQRASNL